MSLPEHPVRITRSASDIPLLSKDFMLAFSMGNPLEDYLMITVY